MDPEILVFDTSPNGNIEAFAEQDDRVCHFYLRGLDDKSNFGIKTCWVRNLKPAPPDDEAAVQDMRSGVPPMLPRDNCRHPNGAQPLTEKELRIVWFEEGDAAALLSGNEILSIVPSWSGYKGFNGYARDCTGEGLLAWQLGTPDENVLFERVRRAEAFWKSWEDNSAPWPPLRDKMASVYEEALGEYSNYYAIDGDKWPPKALIRIPVNDAVVLVTLGVCIRPQPGVEGTVESHEEHRRIELGICLPASVPDEQQMQMADYISAQSCYPWTHNTWLGEGHTIACDSVPKSVGGDRFQIVLLTKRPPGCPPLALPSYRDDPVNVLWLLPVTKAERAYAMEYNSSALKEKLWAVGAKWCHSDRPEADLGNPPS